MERYGPNENQSWLDLAARASMETDEHKLMQLVKELCQALDRSHSSRAMVCLPTEDCV